MIDYYKYSGIMGNYLKICIFKSLILLYFETFKVEVLCGSSAEAPELISIRKTSDCFYMFTIERKCGIGF